MPNTIKCATCNSTIEFPYKEDNIIRAKDCIVIGHIGDDKFTIRNGDTIWNCPSIEVMFDLEIKCKCGSSIFSSDDYIKYSSSD